MHTQLQASGPQPALLDVNPSFLDTLVLEYLAAEDFVEEDSADAQDQLRQRLAAFAAYQHLQQGNVHNAMAIASHCCPAVLEDQRLSFRLKRQQFIELLRQGTTEADAAALACARDELAPLALYAYPEAFLDFKKTLLMLVDRQQQQQQQQSGRQQQQQQQQQLSGRQQRQQRQQLESRQEWSLEARQQLAETLLHTMNLQMSCQAPSLSLLLRYLLHLYQQHTQSAAAAGGGGGSSRSGSSSRNQQQQLQQQAQQLMASKGGKVAQGLLLEGRDEGPLPPDVAGLLPRSTDVQSLMAAVGLARREVEDALKLTGGDLPAALAHQLGRLRLDTPALDALVWEYATARGLLEPADGPEAVAAAIAAAAAVHLSVTDDMEVDADTPLAAAAQESSAAAVALPAAAAAAAGGAAAGQMPPPANRSAKRSKAAISSSGNSGTPSGYPGNSSSSSPFRSSQHGPSAAATAAGSVGPLEGLSLLAAGQNPGQQGGSADVQLNRSASQSPPYKAPRYRRKQTPSRFYCSAAEACEGFSFAPQQQQQQQQWEERVERVVVMGGHGLAAAGAASAANPMPPAACPNMASPGAAAQKGASPQKAASPQRGLRQQQDAVCGGSSANGAALLNGSGAAAADAEDAGVVDGGADGVQQLLDQARAAAQQQRWQQLQQQLKGQSLAGGGAMAEQLRAQEQLGQVQALLQKQQYAEAEALVERLAPGLLQEQHTLLFELKRCQFTALVEAGDLPAALQLARSQLTPLADSHPQLLPAVKASMALLLPGSVTAAGGGSSGSSSGGQKLWDLLLPLLQSRLGVEPPQLVSLLQVLLTAHKAWFVRQRCSDPFASTLLLDSVLAASAGATAAAAGAAATGPAAAARPSSANRGSSSAAPTGAVAAAAGAGAAVAPAAAGGVAARLAAGAAAAGGADWEYYSSVVNVLGGGPAGAAAAAALGDMGDEEDEEEAGDIDEAAVLQVMEVLELPRGTALELLAEHGGDAQAVILAVFGG